MTFGARENPAPYDNLDHDNDNDKDKDKDKDKDNGAIVQSPMEFFNLSVNCSLSLLPGAAVMAQSDLPARRAVG